MSKCEGYDLMGPASTDAWVNSDKQMLILFEDDNLY